MYGARYCSEYVDACMHAVEVSQSHQEKTEQNKILSLERWINSDFSVIQTKYIFQSHREEPFSYFRMNMFELTKIRVHYSSRFCAHATYICTIYVISISRWGKHKQWMKIGVLTIVGLGRQREIDSTICSDMLGCSANLAVNETPHIQKENHKAVSKHRQMASSVFRRFLLFFLLCKNKAKV